MRIVILDGYTENPGDLTWNGFRTLGELTVYDRTPVDDDAEIIRRIGNAEAVYTNKTPIRRTVLEQAPNLKFLGVLATGYNIVDVQTADEHGICVTNIPTYGTAAVSQFAIALLLEICLHIGHHSDQVHAGRWSQCPDFCFWDYPLIELAGKTLGIIGFGRIGQATGRIAKALGMNVIAFDAVQSDAGRQIGEYVDIEELYARADVVSLHCPLFEHTREMICADSIGKMKDGVILLNNSRGQLINEQDLVRALESGKVRAAGLDVVSTEPISEDNPLLRAPNCIITPHISWASIESRQRLMQIAIENLRAYLAGNPINVVHAGNYA